jgi:hypothetical protein
MYKRTRNENGSYGTRCLDCFLTIASSVENDAELDALEARHICPEKALSWLAVEPIPDSTALPRATEPA